MVSFLSESSPVSLAALSFVLGVFVGTILVRIGIQLGDGSRLRSPLGCPGCGHVGRLWQWLPIFGYLLSRGRCRACGQPIGGWVLLTELGTGLLFAAYVTAVLRFKCQTTEEVQPDELWLYGRVLFHFVLLSLLIAATITDFRAYVIPDEITVVGALIGVVGATISGDLQIIHLWVDWNHQLVGVFGPYIPQWMDKHHHPHWHGLAWSLAGLVAGGGVTWTVRTLSSLLLGREALGLGDVTLMAMIGSFLGWQPVLFVFLLAPMCGLAVGLLVRILTGRTYVPFGPFLSAAAIVVLFVWKWLWVLTRDIFGDWRGLFMLAGIALAALVLLLGLLRVYRAIPVTRRSSTVDNPDPDDEADG